MATTYRLATSPRDYTRCRALMREFVEPVALSFPTVMAERDGVLLGFLATQPRKEAVIAGPLMLRDRSPFVTLRLLEAYDNVMRAAGITAYHFYVRQGNAWRSQVERLGFEAWHQDEGGAWYRRTLKAA